MSAMALAGAERPAAKGSRSYRTRSDEAFVVAGLSRLSRLAGSLGPGTLTCFSTATKHIQHTVGSGVHSADSANSLVPTDAQLNSESRCHKALRFTLRQKLHFSPPGFILCERGDAKTKRMRLRSFKDPKSTELKRVGEDDGEVTRASEATKKNRRWLVYVSAGFL